MVDPLSADHTVTYSYRRSVGGAAGRFLGGLAQGRIWGSRGADGRVQVPPLDHDPVTGAPHEGYVAVSDRGVVRSWSWVGAPRPEHPADRPFAFALVQLDGADTSLLHVVDVGDEADMASGMRVRADWRAQRHGSILDIRAFVPDAAGPPPAGRDEDAGTGPADGETELEVHSNRTIAYTYEPGRAASRFLDGLAHRRITGGRCRSCGGVYVPPRPQCPQCRSGPLSEVPLEGRGVVSAYTVVHVPFPEMTLPLPFVAAWIRLDGADVAFPHLLGEVDPEAVSVGQRVQARWAPDEQAAASWESILHFEPEPGPPPEGAA